MKKTSLLLVFIVLFLTACSDYTSSNYSKPKTSSSYSSYHYYYDDEEDDDDWDYSYYDDYDDEDVEEEDDYSIIGYTSRGTPIVDDIELDLNIDWKNTYDSDCFRKIGYDDTNEILYVRFRDSGAMYRYLDVPYRVWRELKWADSKGGYYNEDIKGRYYCEKIDF